MLTRVSCERCGFASLWTDDPDGFLVDACLMRERCEARVRQPIESARSGSVERRFPALHPGIRIRPTPA